MTRKETSKHNRTIRWLSIAVGCLAIIALVIGAIQGDIPLIMLTLSYLVLIVGIWRLIELGAKEVVFQLGIDDRLNRLEKLIDELKDEKPKTNQSQ